MEKSFMDPVHGFIVIDEAWLLALVDAPEFQRLRRIRQLGVSSGTYHGAEHSRFGHSLGAYHIMKRVLQHLQAQGADIPERQRRAGLAAALLHDIGHTPFSHALEHILTPGIGHESWGEAVVTGATTVGRVLADTDPGLPGEVAGLIRGRHGPLWLRQLVASQLDVDRFDYLLRDSLYTGTGYGRFDLERIIHTMRLVDGRLALQAKGVHAAEEYVLARHFMYWRVYLHKTIRAQELMLRGATTRARELFQAGERVFLPAALEALWSLPGGAGGLAGYLQANGWEAALPHYLELDDADMVVALKAWRHSSDPTLADLSRRLLERDLLKPLYRYAVEAVPPEVEAEARSLVEGAGWDPRYYCLLDAPAAAYGADGAGGGTGGWEEEPILIVGSGQVPVELPSLSSIIAALSGSRQQAANLYLPGELRDRMRRRLKPSPAAPR